MIMLFPLVLLAVSSVLAAPRQSSSLTKRCVNSAEDRSCWGDYDLSTDYYDTTAVPDTGIVREYWFNVQNGTAAPDGVERVVLTVNGTYPGPTIIADWGDTVVVHVTNSMVRIRWPSDASGDTLMDSGKQRNRNTLPRDPSISLKPDGRRSEYHPMSYSARRLPHLHLEGHTIRIKLVSCEHTRPLP